MIEREVRSRKNPRIVVKMIPVMAESKDASARARTEKYVARKVEA